MRNGIPTEKDLVGPEADPAAAIHVPVLLEEVLEGLFSESAGKSGALSRPWRYLDGTLGLGGHAGAVLKKATALYGRAELLGLDRDAEALALAGQRLAAFGGAAHLKQSGFADFEAALDELGWDFIDGALVDLGVSSLQLDRPERGFSFIHDGPLDMRMNPHGGHEPASALVNRAPVQRLREIIGTYGEEPQAGRIARAIDDARAQKPIESTLELADIVERAYPAKWRATARNHPATRTFQALRLVVNEELEQIGAFLERLVPRLTPGGRVAVISFHSLEDRIVKHFFKTAASGCLCPPRLLKCACGHQASLKLVTRKALEPSEAEVKANPRARSAKLRVAERTDKPFTLPPGLPEGQGEGRGGKKYGKAPGHRKSGRR